MGNWQLFFLWLSNVLRHSTCLCSVSCGVLSLYAVIFIYFIYLHIKLFNRLPPPLFNFFFTNCKEIEEEMFIHSQSIAVERICFTLGWEWFVKQFWVLHLMLINYNHSMPHPYRDNFVRAHPNGSQSRSKQRIELGLGLRQNGDTISLSLICVKQNG